MFLSTSIFFKLSDKKGLLEYTIVNKLLAQFVYVSLCLLQMKVVSRSFVNHLIHQIEDLEI